MGHVRSTAERAGSTAAPDGALRDGRGGPASEGSGFPRGRRRRPASTAPCACARHPQRAQIDRQRREGAASPVATAACISTAPRSPRPAAARRAPVSCWCGAWLTTGLGTRSSVVRPALGLGVGGGASSSPVGAGGTLSAASAGRHLVGIEGSHQPRRDQDHQLGPLGALCLALEQDADDRELARSGSRTCRPARVVEQSGDGERLPVAQLHGLGAASAAPGSKPWRVMPLLKSSELTSGFTSRRIVAGDRRLERQPDAELLELDRHRVGGARRRNRELAAGEEARLWPLKAIRPARPGSGSSPSTRAPSRPRRGLALVEEEQVEKSLNTVWGRCRPVGQTAASSSGRRTAARWRRA